MNLQNSPAACFFMQAVNVLGEHGLQNAKCFQLDKGMMSGVWLETLEIAEQRPPAQHVFPIFFRVPEKLMIGLISSFFRFRVFGPDAIWSAEIRYPGFG